MLARWFLANRKAIWVVYCSKCKSKWGIFKPDGASPMSECCREIPSSEYGKRDFLNKLMKY